MFQKLKNLKYLRKPYILLAVSAIIFIPAILFIFTLLKGPSSSDDSSSQALIDCGVLEERFCAFAEPIEVNGEFIGVGFTLPPDTPIFSDRQGLFSPQPYTLLGQEYSAVSVSSEDNETIITYVLESIIEDDTLPQTSPETKTVEKGEEIARTSSESLGINGDYNLVIFFANEGTVNKDQTIVNFSL